MALEWLDEIEARVNAATPGPWEAFEMDETDEGTLRRGPWWIQQESTGRILFDGAATKEADAEFVAHARTDVPLLCRAVRELADALATAVAMAESWAFDAHPGWKAEVGRAKGVLERWKRGDA